MTDTEVATAIVFYLSNKLNINAIPQDSTNDIASVSLNYLPSTKVFSVMLDITHRLTNEENINEIAERNIKWFTNDVKWKLGLDNPSRVYKDIMSENWKLARVILMYDLTEDIENTLLLLSKMK
jgi:hypothetical protein